jgi:hypothetical protein
MWHENGANVARMARMKEESVKCKVTAEKKKIELFLGKKCAKIAQKNAQKVLHHYDVKKMQKMKQKDISLIGAKRAKKKPKEQPNEKLALTEDKKELKPTYLLRRDDSKMTQKLAQKLEINSFDFSKPKLQISAHNESIMSQNMSQKGESNL